MVNRFFRRTPYDIGLYVPPVDVIKESMAMAQKQYDTNYALADAVKNNFINSLPQDRQAANELQKGWESQVDELVNSYGGDYSKIGKKLGNLLNSIKREYNPGGKAHAITSNFGNYTTWIKEHQDRVAKGNVLGEDLNLANSYYMKNYTGIGEIDPVTGSYNRFNPDTLTDYRDPNKIIQDTFKEFKPEKRKVGTSWTDEKGFVHYSEQEQEGITPDRLAPSFQTALAADPQYSSYIQQKAKFIGLSPEEAQTWSKNYANQRAQDLSYMSSSNTDKMERDPLYVARAKANMDKENIDYMYNLQQYGETTNGLLSSEPTFNPDDWRNSLLDPTTNSFYPGSGALPGNYPGVANYGKEQIEKGVSLGDFLNGKNDAKIQNKWNMSPQLLKTMWNDYKESTPDFNRKYGKDPVWTANFEKSFLKDAKAEAKNHSSYQIVEHEIPEPARDQNLLRALRASVSNKWPTFKIGSNVSSAGLPKDILDTIYDEKEGKFKNLDLLDITYVQAGPGVKAAGYKIATPNGSIVIEDQNGSRKAYSDMAAAALNPIYFDGRKMGGGQTIYDVDQSGNPLFGVPMRQFDATASGHYDDFLYMVEPGSTEDNFKYLYETVVGPNGKPMKVPVKRTAAQVAAAQLPAYKDALGTGQSKQDAMPFNFFSRSM